MTEVYTLRAPENFNYKNNNNNHHRPISKMSVKNNRAVTEQKRETYHLRSNNDTPVRWYNHSKPSSPPRNEYSTSRPTTVTINNQRKSPVSSRPSQKQKQDTYHETTGGRKTSQYNKQPPPTNNIHQKPKSNGILTHSNSPSPKRVTTYMITSSPRNNFVSPIIPRTPTPPMRSNRKNLAVSFDTVDHNDKHEIMSRQRHISPSPMSRSKANESIYRSMNKYRFRRY